MAEPTQAKGERPLGTGPIGVCSWSLQPGSVAELVARLNDVALPAVQLALDPVRTGAMPLAEIVDAFDGRRIILSGMMAMAGEDYTTLASIRETGGIVPDATWPANLAAAAENARLARLLGLELVTFHAGFVPHEASDPRRKVLLERIARVAALFAEQGVAVALETGQESAATQLALLEELGPGTVGINFDPANMILYGKGDPIEALRALAPHVRQVHIKDAVPAGVPGEWGEEVRLGEGAVDWAAFIEVVRTLPRRVALVIECEAGSERVRDVAHARDMLFSLLQAQ